MMVVTSSSLAGSMNILLTSFSFIYPMGDTFCWGIFFARDGPIDVKKSLNLSLIKVLLVVMLLSLTLNLVLICDCFPLLTISFSIDHVFFHITFG